MLNTEKKNEISHLIQDKHFNSIDQGIKFLVSLKSSYQLSWDDVALLAHDNFGLEWKEGFYRRNYGEYCNYALSDDETESKILQLKKERVKLADERNQNSAYVRRLAREETIKEIAAEAVDAISKTKQLIPFSGESIDISDESKEGLLLISDWHYGLEFSNPWNTFSPEIVRERVAKLTRDTIKYCKKYEIGRLRVLNLADLIAGRIHLTIRLESRIDVITQIMEVSEILAEMLYIFHTAGLDVDYYSCTDNHSRVEPDKTQSLDLESLCRITDWYLSSRVGDIINIHENEFGDDIITLDVLGHKILGVHGDRDKQQTVIEKMTLLTRQSYDLICTAHLHHFSADEHTGTLMVSNGALMGSDSYSVKLRLHSKPSQTFVVVGKDNVAEGIHRIILD